MAVPQWKFILVNSKDLSEIGELHQARDKSLNLALNTPGSASFTYSFEGNLAADIQPISTGVMAYRKGSTDSYKLVWSGYINEIAEDVTNATMTVSAVGWFERLNKRIARQDVLYKNQYDKDIIIGDNLSVSFTNPSFQTNTSGWTASASTITRVASGYYSSPACGRWDNTGASDAVDFQDTLTATLSGTFYSGRTYTINGKIKASGQHWLYAYFGTSANKTTINDGSGALANTGNNTWADFTITWVPTTTVSSGVTFTLDDRSAFFGFNAYYLIDSLSVYDSGNLSTGIVEVANLTSSIPGYTIASGTIPVVAGSNPYTPTWLDAGTYYDGMRSPIATASGPAKQDISIEQDSSFGEAIMTLINQENGCDIEVDPANRQLNVYGKKGSVKSDVWFGFNWGPENIVSFSNQISTADIANYLVGRATGITAQLVYNKDSYSVENYGIFEDSLNINLTSTTDAATKLAAYTAAEYFFRSGPEFSYSDSPFSTYSITPYPYTIGSSVPEPFEAYNIGDIVKFRAVREPRVDVEGSFRVFGMSVSISNDGNESIGDLRMYAS